MGPIVDSSLVVIAGGVFVLAIVSLCRGLTRLVNYHVPERVGVSVLKPKHPDPVKPIHVPDYEYDVYREQIALGRVLPYTKLRVTFTFEGETRVLGENATTDMLVAFRTTLRQFSNDSRAPSIIAGYISDLLLGHLNAPPVRRWAETWVMTLEAADLFPERVLNFKLAMKNGHWTLQLEPNSSLYHLSEDHNPDLGPWRNDCA